MDWQPLVYGLQLQSSPVCGLFAVHRTGLSNTTDEAVGIIWLLDGAGVRLRFAIEEFIRILCKGTTMALGVGLEDR
jgi:hypothetical protein